MIFPKISIVTPSFNQGRFIGETILSVIGQLYPNLEYIIIDGGSNDETVDIIKQYANHISYWVSEKDRGQSHAINKGFEKATGDIFAWLNSDDLYMPGTLHKMAACYNLNSAAIHYGNCLHFEQKGDGVYGLGSDVTDFPWQFLVNANPIIQPSSFWPAAAWQSAGPLREDMHFGFDWEWFLRAQKHGQAFQPVKEPLSLYRFHETHKTGSGGDKRRVEILKIYREYNERLADLYALLMEEDFINAPFYFKATRKSMELSGKDYVNARTLKLYKKEKYKQYSVYEIAGCITML